MIRSVLIANRGEISVRIARAAIDLGIRSVAVYAEDDEGSLHTVIADESIALPGKGVSAYLNKDALIAAAKRSGCDAIHPGYGFLSESSDFAAACEAEDIIFVGPRSETLNTFGDKARARAIAVKLGVPVLEGTDAPLTVEGALEFFDKLGEGAVMVIKAVAGGGGRGMRMVSERSRVEAEYRRCASEAERYFGNGAIYAERAMVNARHVEVQIVGDGSGQVVHLFERECSIQRRHQKLIEIAPAPALSPSLRDSLLDAAVRMASSGCYKGVGTFEFLVDAQAYDEGGSFAFMEANPRLQVEHTVTEEVTGLDLVQIQLLIAGGFELESIGLRQEDISLRGHAIQLRVNMEAIDINGVPRPSSGTLEVFDIPSGPGVRTDTFAYAGYRTSMSFDPLLAKVIAFSPSNQFSDAIKRAVRAIDEFRIEGISTNLRFLRNILLHEAFQSGDISTKFIEKNATALAASNDDVDQIIRYHSIQQSH